MRGRAARRKLEPLIFILVAAPVGSITFWGWLMVALGVLADLSSHAQSYANRNSARAVLPLDDRTAIELITLERPHGEPPRARYIYFPDTTAVPESAAVNIRGRSYKVIADIALGPDASGVIFAHGSRFGGHALFVKDMQLYYVYNFPGIQPEQTFVSSRLSPGKYTLGMEFIRERPGLHGESLGATRLYVNLYANTRLATTATRSPAALFLASLRRQSRGVSRPGVERRRRRSLAISGVPG